MAKIIRAKNRNSKSSGALKKLRKYSTKSVQPKGLGKYYFWNLEGSKDFFSCGLRFVEYKLVIVAGVANSKTKIKMDKDIMYRPDSDGSVVIILLTNSKSYFKLDGLAAKCWSHFDGKKSAEKISQLVAKKTGHDERRVLADLLEMLPKLEAKGLVVLR